MRLVAFPQWKRVEFIDALWESLEADVPALTDEQTAELDDRVVRYQNNPSECDSMGASQGGRF
jgi:putative addiction module component (TIGR02574 family)